MQITFNLKKGNIQYKQKNRGEVKNTQNKEE